MVDTTGFVTALVINGAIALVATLLFVWWRPQYPWCYDTRRDAKRRVIGTEPPTVPPGAFAWLPKTISYTDAQVLSTAGLDALMFIKFFEMCATLFSALCVLGIGILLPTNYTSSNDITDSFDQMSMANIPTGNRRFWAHLIIAYIFSAIFYYLALHTWKSYLNLRHQFLAKWTLLGGNHTIMIHELPLELRSDSALLAYFQRQFPGQIRSARMAKNLSMPKGNGNELESLPENAQARNDTVAALEHDVLAWEKQQQDPKIKDEEKRKARPQAATKMMCCGKVDAIDHHYAELARLNGLVANKQKEFNGRDGAGPAGDQVPCLLSGFVTFHSSRAAVSAARAFVYDATPYSFEVKAAPELRDVYWPNMNLSHRSRSIRTIIGNVLAGLLIVFWMIPMGILMGVSNLSGLREKYSWLDGIKYIPTVILGFIEAYLPAIMLIVFFIVLPMILLAFSKMQGIEAHSWLQKSVIHKYFLFMVVNFFFGAIVGGAIFSNISALLSDVNSVPSVLGEQIPTVANYFVNYVALAAFAGFPLQMSQVGRLIGGGVKKKFLALSAREYEAAEAPPSLDYGVAYCPHLFIFLVAMTYSFISPIIIPFAAVYFMLGWVVYKYQLVHVFVQSFESGGVFWPCVYSKMSSSLFIAQVCLVGILGLKQVPAQAALVVPLPFLTIAFDRYIHGAIKSKLGSLPLPQLVEIDALRKAERVERERRGSKGSAAAAANGHAAAAASSSSAGAGDLEGGNHNPEGSPETVGPLSSDLSKLDLQYESRGEDCGGPGHHAAPKPGTHKLVPHAVTEEENNGVTKSTRSYMLSEGDHAPRTLGFPYADTEQDRAYVEGDVPAYIQPELTDAVPSTVEVARAEQYLSSAPGGGAEAARAPAPGKQLASDKV